MTNDMKSDAIRVLFAGGGTGGHLMPALATAQTLKNKYPHAQILFVGTADRIEAKVVPEAGFDFKAISVHGLAGKWTPGGLLKRLRGVAEILTALPIWQAMKIIRQFRPQVIVGSGGYVCGPVLAAARLAGVPAMLLEQNEEIGYTSRLVAGMIKIAVVVSEPSGHYFIQRKIRTEVVGNPVRPAIILTTREEGISALALEPSRKTVTVCGGSLGSSMINDACEAALRQLAKEKWFADGWQVIHLTGPQRGGGLPADEVKATGIRYQAFPYLNNVQHLLAVSDLVITRAGGTFLAEIAARGIPAIIIPWSEAASDHQTENALPFVAAGAAVVITDAELNGDTLYQALYEILPDSERLEKMSIACRTLSHPQAAEKIVAFIEELAACQ